MAGSYQPEAMQQLARIEPPAFVAVVGKPNLFTTQDGNCLVSVRTESITVVDRETRDLWVLDTARSTLDRLDAFGTTDDSRKAMEEYGTQVPHVYRKIVYEALTQVHIKKTTLYLRKLFFLLQATVILCDALFPA
jgi:RPA family protein